MIHSDQWLSLKDVCELRKREKNSSHLAFLDVSKTYNCGGSNCSVK